MSAPFHLRPYRAEDEDAAIALWLQTLPQAPPLNHFAAPRASRPERRRGQLVPKAQRRRHPAFRSAVGHGLLRFARNDGAISARGPKSDTPSNCILANLA